MRVLLDASAGARADPSGIGRYVLELIRALPGALGEDPLTLGLRLKRWRGRRYLPALPPKSSARGSWLIDDRLDSLTLKRFDVFHGPDARITPARHVARVATLHDVFSLQRDDLARAGFRARKRQRYAEIAEAADQIVCVSEATRRAFLEEFPDAAPRACVVHHGISSRFRPAPEEELARLRSARRLPRPYLLFLGLLNSRKNLPVLLTAFDRVAGRRDDLELVLAGRRSTGFDQIERTLEALGHRERVRLLDFVPSADLPALISGARALILPSVAEGFGFPILEAFACGTEALASDLPVLREIGGDLLYTAAPGSPEEFATRIEEILDAGDSPDRCAALIEWAGRFRWARCAEETVAAYRRALEVRQQR